MRQLRSFFEYLSGPGISKVKDHSLEKQIRLTNVISLVMGATTVPFLIHYAVQSQWWLFSYNVIPVVLMGIVLLLNHQGRFYASRWSLILFSDLLILLGSFYGGRAVQMHLSYFILACLPLIVFSLKDRWSIRILVATAAFLYLAVETLPFFQTDHTIVNPMLGRAGEGLGILLILSSIIYYFRASNERYEARLEALLEQLTQQQGLIVQSSKMSALGEMAGGIAHEINNPLTVLQVGVACLRALDERQQLTSATLRPPLLKMEETVKRIAKIIHGLKTFAREGATDPFQPESVDTLLRTTLNFCQERFAMHGVRIELSPVQKNIAVECRAVQVSQILLNLLNNAFDAVLEVPEKWVRIEVTPNPKTVEISVTDSGLGIPISLRDKIFQPFFTTKKVGMGTGLGLSISKGLAESEKGSLSLDPTSPPTRFVLTLRRA